MKNIFIVSLVFSLLFSSLGCDKVTYPKAKLQESIIDLCKREYNIDVNVSLVGETLAIYLPLDSLFDITLSLSEGAQNKIQDVLLGASRVALSTDADIKFYCIIAQDVRIPQIQMIIIKYTEDIKRAFYYDISRGEYFKRTLIDINENPQARKEHAIIDVFGKMKLDKEMQEKVLDDFFRSPPSTLEGIGYWQGKFYVKDITLKEFLAQQMTSRIKMKFRQDEDLKRYTLKSVTGKFVEANKPEFFLISFRTESLLFVIEPEKRQSIERDIFSNAFQEMADVIYGYKFDHFGFIKIVEENYKRELLTSKEDVYLFKKGKLNIDTILGAISG